MDIITYKVIKSFQAFLFEPKIEKVFPFAFSESYVEQKMISFEILWPVIWIIKVLQKRNIAVIFELMENIDY